MTRIYNTKSTTSSSTSNANESSSGMIPDIEDLHRQAVLCKSNTYIDPSTGFTVFTEFAHLKRGTCCGNKCRHCPFGWENVDLMQTKSQGGGISSSSSSSSSQQDTVTTTITTGNDENDNDENGSLSFVKPKTPRVKSGQRQEIAKLLEKIHQGTYFDNDEKFEYPQNNMSSSLTLLEKEEAEKEEKKKNVDMKKMDTLDSLSCLGYTVAPSITATSFSSNSTSSSSSSFNTSINSASNSSHGSCTSSTCDNIPLDEEAEEHEDEVRQRCTSKNVPYTRSGDLGMSMLLNGERRSKDDEAFESMGTVDELCSTVGVVHVELDYMKEQKNDHLQESSFKENIIEVQSQLVEIMCHLFDIGSHLAKPRKKAGNSSLSLFEADGVGNGFHKEHIDILETWIDNMTEQMPELLSFILPTGSRASAQLHVARCVCRRAERRVQPLVRDGLCDPNAAKYLNRLSDYLFTAARYCNFVEGRDEIQYKRPSRAIKQRSCVKVELRDYHHDNNSD